MDQDMFESPSGSINLIQDEIEEFRETGIFNEILESNIEKPLVNSSSRERE